MPLPEFDFIIVGTGSGGGHAAARLVNAGFKVLSLEAGGDFWDTATATSDNRPYLTQIGANDETLWDWDYRSEAEVTGYVGTWGGTVTVVATGAVGATITINGLALTPAGGARTPGANDYDDTLPTTATIAENIWLAINDPLNGFKVRGIKVRASQSVVIIDRIYSAPSFVGGVVTLATSNAAKSAVLVVSGGVGCTVAQATIREVDQSMGRMVGGSGNHFGYLCYRAALEDYDEQDYAILKSCTAALNGQGTLTGTMDFSAAPVGFLKVVTGVGTQFLTELSVGDYIQDMTGGAPYATIPFRVQSIASNTSLTIESVANAAYLVGHPFPVTGAGASAVKNSIWNRSRMLTQYVAIEKDLQYGPAGTNPSAIPQLHGSNAFPATELGYVGKDGLGDTGAWNSAPPATSRVPVALNAMVTSLVGSALGFFPFPFHLTIDRNAENSWGTAPGFPVAPGVASAAVTGVDPYSVHKIPVNEIGFDSASNPLAGGRQTGGLFHLNKYSERRSQLIVAIDPIRSNPLFTIRANCTVNKVLLENSGSGLTAVGVEYYQREEEGGEWTKKVVYGTNIVVSAGPIGSPAVLLRSGIGPIDRLAPHGIVQILDLPGVGNDVLNHQSAGAGSGFSFTLPTENNILLNGVYYAGLYKSSFTMSPSRAADFAVGSPPVLFDQGPECRFNLGAGTGNENAPISRNQFGLAEKQGRKAYGNTVTIGSNQFKNRSRGDGVRLRSAWPFDPPEFRDGRVENPNAFEAEAFIELSTVLSAKLTDAGVPGGLVATFPTGVASLATVVNPVTPAKIASIHAGVTTSLHAVSTVKIGPPSEIAGPFRSCLDQFARVYGVKGLAVCDNSIYPTHTRANPHLPTVAAAENLTAAWIQRGGLFF